MLVSINEVALRWARLVLGWVTVYLRAGKPSQYLVSHPGQLSLAIIPGRQNEYKNSLSES